MSMGLGLHLGRHANVNVERRLSVHNSGGSQHTASLRPWTLIAYTVFTDSESATKFESYLKTGSGRAFSKRHFI